MVFLLNIKKKRLPAHTDNIAVYRGPWSLSCPERKFGIFKQQTREKKTKNRKGSLNLGLNVLFEKIRPMSLLILPFSREGEPFVLRLSQPNSIQVESDRLVG
jgi:hypothetical protein